MPRPTDVTPNAPTPAYLLAFAAGVVLWFGTAALGGRAEAWDSPLYWKLAYPLSILVAGVLGYRFPRRPWRWGLAVMLAQALSLALSAASFGLLPLGLAMFGVLAIPPAAAATLTARLRLRRGEG